MPRDITVTFADGTTHTYQGAPDTVTPDEVQAHAEKQFAKTVKGIDGGKKAEAQPSSGKGFFQTIGDPILGASLGIIRGARDVVDTGAEALSGGYDKLFGGSEQARVKGINASDLADYEQQTKGSIVAPVARVASQVGVTSPVGGAIAKGLAMVPKVAQAIPGVLSSIRTSGMTAGGGNIAQQAAKRAIGGAVTGGASAGLVKPEDADEGAMIGAVAPIAFNALGVFGGKLGKMAWDALTPQVQVKAIEMAKMTGRPLDEILSALRQKGPSQVPGSEKTVPQILQDPNISQVARTLKSSGQNDLGAREALNSDAQIAALERVAPTAGTINDARANLGGAVERFARPAEEAARGRVGALFDAVPPDQAQMHLPINQMEAARSRFLGPGTFGKGGAPVDQAIDEATTIGTRRVPGEQLEYSSSDASRGGRPFAAPAETVSRAVPFDQLQKLRSSIGEAIDDAKAHGRNQAAAALTTMKNAIDNKVGAVAAGEVQPGDVFTPEAIDAWGQALAAHAEKKARFNTGPQAALFRKGSDGLPAKEGAEVAPMFWNGGNSQIENMQAFRRLTQDDQSLIRLMKSNATTEALQNGAKGPMGQLTFAAFDKWLKNHSGAARELFSDSELATLKAIRDETQTATRANTLGQAQGSNTAQNIFSMGALDSPKLKALASGIPILKHLTGPALSAIKNQTEANRNQILSRLLADPDHMAKAIEEFSKRQTPNRLKQLLTGAPGQLLYRAAPIAIAQ